MGIAYWARMLLIARDESASFASYCRFDVKAATDLFDAEAQIVYCLKKDINRFFFRKTVIGELNKALATTVSAEGP